MVTPWWLVALKDHDHCQIFKCSVSSISLALSRCLSTTYLPGYLIYGLVCQSSQFRPWLQMASSPLDGDTHDPAQDLAGLVCTSMRHNLVCELV